MWWGFLMIRRLILGVALLFSAPAFAQSADAGIPAGWWISIGDLPAQTSKSGIVRTFEEVLIIDEAGMVEDRIMTFGQPSPSNCASDPSLCHDLPLAWKGELSVDDDVWIFSERVEGTEPIDRIEAGSPLLRAFAILARNGWRVTSEADGQRLVLDAGDGSPERVFAKIDPQSLKRIRAAFFVPQISAADHWRCFLGNAMAGNAAFDPLGGDPAHRPEWFDDFARGASYLQALRAIFDTAVSDRDGATQTPPLDRRLVEEFDTLATPTDAEERDALVKRYQQLLLRIYASGEDGSPDLGLDEAAIEALKTANAAMVEASQSGSGLFNDLYCLNFRAR